MSVEALAAIVFTAASLGSGLNGDDAQCKIIRYAADGARTETAPTRPYTRPQGAGASVRSSSKGSSHAAVSASSSSGGESSATTTRAEGDGRTVTKTYDNQGCTIVIDARRPGAER